MGTFTASVINSFTSGYSRLDITYTITDTAIPAPTVVSLDPANIGNTARSQVSFPRSGVTSNTVQFVIYCKFGGEPSINLTFSVALDPNRSEKLTGSIQNPTTSAGPGTFAPVGATANLFILDTQLSAESATFSVLPTSSQGGESSTSLGHSRPTSSLEWSSWETPARPTERCKNHFWMEAVEHTYTSHFRQLNQIH